MRKTYLLTVSVVSVLVSLALASIFPEALTPANINAQSSCCNPPRLDDPSAPIYAPQATRWMQGVQVTVTIDTQFTGAEKATIQEAFEAWNAARIENCSRVTFVGFDYGSDQGAGTQFIPNYYVRLRNENSGNRGDTDVGGPPPYSNYARTTLNNYFRVGYVQELSPAALRRLMKHEIGHTLDLLRKSV